MKKRLLFLCLALLVVFAGFNIRVALHDFHGLEGDDGVSLSVSLGNDANTLIRELLALHMDIHPPLHYLALKGWVGVVGDNLLALRMLNILADLLAGAVLMRAAGRALNRRAGLLAGVLWSVSPLLVYATYLIRMYSLMALFAALGLLGVIEAVYVRPRQRYVWYGLAAIAALAAVYTHIVGTVVLVGVGLGIVTSGLVRRVRLLDVLVGLGWLVAASVLSLPYLGPIWEVYRSGRQLGAQYSSATFNDPLNAAAASLTVMLTHQLWGERIALGILLIAALGSVVLWRRCGRRIVPLLVMFWADLAAMSGLAWIAHIYKPRYLTAFVPITLMLLAGIILESVRAISMARRASLLHRSAVKPVLMIAIVLMIFASSAGVLRDLDRTLRDDFAAAAQFVKAHEKPGDVVIVIPDYGWYPFKYHFHGKAPIYGMFSRVNIAANFELGLQPLIEGREGVWYVLYQADVADPDGMADTWLRERGAVVTEVYPRSIRLKYYDLRPKMNTLPPMVRPLDIRFGNAALRGVYLPVMKGSARDTRLHPPSNWVQVVTYWETLQPGMNFVPCVRLIDSIGQVYGGTWRRDNDLLSRSPMTTWKPGEIWRIAYDLNLNPQTPPGKYYIEVSALDPTTEQPILTSTGALSVTAGEFVVR